MTRSRSKPTKRQREALHSAIGTRLLTAKIRAAYSGFHTWKNPLYLLEGFVTAHRAGMPMPDWILDAILPLFEKVLTARGAVTLDTAFGLTGTNGKRKPWTERMHRIEDARLKALFDRQLKKEKLPLVSDKPGAPSAVKAVAVLLGYDPDHDDFDKQCDSLRQTYLKRVKSQNTRLSRTLSGIKLT